MNVSFLRHSGFFGPEDAEGTYLNIIGVGATGSNIGLICAKMGITNFRIWDHDIVESHNLPNQIFSLEDIGSQKVDAFERILKAFNPLIKVEKHPYYFKSSNHKELLNGPLVIAVDSMKARFDIYNAFKLNYKIKRVFETRLGFSYGELNIIDNLSISNLEKWYNCLYTDEQAEEPPCNLRICTTLVSLIASYTGHKICDSLSCERRNKEFKFQKKTMIQFDESQLLNTFSV